LLRDLPAFAVTLMVSVALMGMTGCRDPYMPPAVTAPNAYLVVDGTVLSGPDSSYLTLSRTVSLSDSDQSVPETSANLLIEDQSGAVHTFHENGNGLYVLPPTTFPADRKYHLIVRTRDGSQFTSDFTEVKASPPIDSIFWRKDGDLTLYVATHDPSEQTRYYRWSFTEDWEYDSYYNALVGYDRNIQQLYPKTAADMTTQCFRSDHSKDVLIATTANLAHDVVDSQRIHTIAANTERLSTRYSIEVTQYALTRGSFEYWQLLKKNSNQLGTIFDPQPSQVTGNIHNTNHPDEPVIGLFSISGASRMRIFIRNAEVAPWSMPDQAKICEPPKNIRVDSAQYYLYDPAWEPAYYITDLTGGVQHMAIARKECVDCRTRGGSTVKPPYW
jgi:hypothetical protein